MEKLPHAMKVLWAILVLAALFIGGMDPEQTVIMFVIVTSSWACTRIIYEAIESTVELLKRDEE
jgi:hypothetical protein